MKDLAKQAPLLVALFVKSKAKTMQNGFVNLQLNDQSLTKLYPHMTNEALRFRLFGGADVMLALYQKADPLAAQIDWQSEADEKLVQIHVTSEAVEAVSGNSGNSSHTQASGT